jgi:hypothetical protein
MSRQHVMTSGSANLRTKFAGNGIIILLFTGSDVGSNIRGPSQASAD